MNQDTMPDRKERTATTFGHEAARGFQPFACALACVIMLATMWPASSPEVRAASLHASLSDNALTNEAARLFGEDALSLQASAWPEETLLSSRLFAPTKMWPGLSLLEAYGVGAARVVAQSNGAEFYVSRGGRDSGNGSAAAPWRTIMYALSRARAGDTVFVRGGLYSENVTFPRSGRQGAPITLAGYPGETVILDGTGLPERNCFTVTTQSYITIDGFTVRNYSLGGTPGFAFVQWDDVAVDGLTLRNLEVYNVGTPVKVGANGGSVVRSNITVENLNAHDYAFGGIDLGPGAVAGVTIRQVRLSGLTSGDNTGADGIAVENGARILIEDAMVRGHQGDGVDCKADRVTLRRVDVRGHTRNGIKVWKGDSLIENCWVSGSRTGLGALVLPGSGAYTVRDSVFLGTGGESGTMKAYTVELGRYGAAANDAPTRVTLTGNTFHTEGNDGVLIYLADNARLSPDSDDNTYYSPRQDTIFAGARNADGAALAEVTPALINSGAWARFLRGEAHSKFSPKLPAPAGRPTPPAVAPRRVTTP